MKFRKHVTEILLRMSLKTIDDQKTITTISLQVEYNREDEKLVIINIKAQFRINM